MYRHGGVVCVIDDSLRVREDKCCRQVLRTSVADREEERALDLSAERLRHPGDRPARRDRRLVDLQSRVQSPAIREHGRADHRAGCALI